LEQGWEKTSLRLGRELIGSLFDADRIEVLGKKIK